MITIVNRFAHGRQQADGGVADRTRRLIDATFGPTSACAGMSGPPAIDIGM
jgi:hypothetical protein